MSLIHLNSGFFKVLGRILNIARAYVHIDFLRQNAKLHLINHLLLVKFMWICLLNTRKVGIYVKYYKYSQSQRLNKVQIKIGFIKNPRSLCFLLLPVFGVKYQRTAWPWRIWLNIPERFQPSCSIISIKSSISRSYE